MKKKLIIGGLVLILGIGLAVMGILITKNNLNENKEELEIEENKPQVENKYQESELIIFDFTEKESDQDIKVSFDIYNNGNETIKDMSLFLDYYENNENIYTYQFDIDDLKVGEELKITDESIVFLYDKLSGSKFRFDNKEVPIVSREEYLKEYGSLDKNKIKVEEEDTE